SDVAPGGACRCGHGRRRAAGGAHGGPDPCRVRQTPQQPRMGRGDPAPPDGHGRQARPVPQRGRVRAGRGGPGRSRGAERGVGRCAEPAPFDRDLPAGSLGGAGARLSGAGFMPSMPPGTAAVRAGVRTLLRNRVAVGALAAGDLVLVACSGGADSLALAAATAFVAPRLGLRAGAVSVDHGMQPGSERVARRAIDQCADLGLDPALVRPAGAAPTGQGPEAAARAVRYRALEEAAVQTGAAAILLGHTMDDQAETVLLALARGSGTR